MGQQPNNIVSSSSILDILNVQMNCTILKCPLLRGTGNNTYFIKLITPNPQFLSAYPDKKKPCLVSVISFKISLRHDPRYQRNSDEPNLYWSS